MTDPNGFFDFSFGAAVTIDGDNVAVGAPGVYGEDFYGTPLFADHVGAVFIFSRTDGVWQQQTQFLKPNHQGGDLFGIDIALQGNQLIVGADQSRGEFNPPDGIGTAVVYENNDGNWIAQHTLTASDGMRRDQFGRSVAMDNGRFFVGALGHSVEEELRNSGGVYMYAQAQSTAFIETLPSATTGGNVTLRWHTSNADTAIISPGVGNVAPSGELTVPIDATTTYTLTASGPYGTATHSATAFVNTPPVISLLAPEGFTNIADRAFTIRWDDQDPDSNASISLYYDNDRCGNDGKLIAEGIAEDPEADGDAYVWDPINVPDGQYFIYAVIDDGINSASIVYGSGSITVKHPAASISPTFSGGVGHTAVIDDAGLLYTWGFNNHGQIGDGTTVDRDLPWRVSGLSHVRNVACGSFHTFAVKTDGTVWAWGQNDYGQLGIGSIQERTVPTPVAGIGGGQIH